MQRNPMTHKQKVAAALRELDRIQIDGRLKKYDLYMQGKITYSQLHDLDGGKMAVDEDEDDYLEPDPVVREYIRVFALVARRYDLTPWYAFRERRRTHCEMQRIRIYRAQYERVKARKAGMP